MIISVCRINCFCDSTDNSRFYSIPLVVGRRIAQIVFFDSDGTLKGRSYEDTGKYQTSNDMQKLFDSWNPSEMLPKMYLDREIKTGSAREVENTPKKKPANKE